MNATVKYTTQGGDSGGPWFYNTTAHGIHHGYTTIDGYKRSLFTPAADLYSSLGVQIYR